MLRVDANSMSCVIAYQPKAPKELARFRKDK
ncbi:MAG: cyclic lactone autoinducer peptide [Tyzzerella sp.]|nr:cyclic lactone autoinducer peptide [Tyzzerella sp.]